MVAYMTKTIVLDIVNSMPDSFTVDEVMYKLYILSNHEKAMADIDNNNVYSTNEVRRIIAEKTVMKV